jgi:hypothetical protein
VAPDNCDRSGSRKAGLNGIRVGRVSGYQFIGLSKTTQNTYSNIEISPALEMRTRQRGRTVNTDSELLPDGPEREAVLKEIAQFRMRADCKEL